MSTSLTFDILARDRASDKFDHVGDSASRSTGKLKKFAAVGAAAVAAGAVIAGKALWDMGKAAAEDEKSQALLAKALQNNAGATKGQVAAVEDWITAQGKAKGIADDQLRPALSKLVTATHDVGKAQKLAALAMDVSAGSGKSLDAVSTALMKAQNGQVSGLSRLGIATKDAEGKTLTFEQATKKMADTFGGSAAKAAETTEGKFGRLKLMFDETKESIGAKLLPIGNQLADWMLNKGAPAAAKLGDWFQQKLMPPLRDFAGAVAPRARQVMEAMKGAFEDARPFMDMMGKVLTNVVVPGLKKLVEVAGPVLVGNIKMLGKALGLIGDAGRWMWNNALQPAFKALVVAIAAVADGFALILRGIGKLPKMDWADRAADSLSKTAEKARAVADGLKKIPPRKDVSVVVTYKYVGLRGEGGSGPTRGREDDLLGGTSGRMAQKTAAQRFMDAISDGIEQGGKKLDKVLKASRDRLKEKLGAIRDEMRSMSQSIASAINPTDFSAGITELMASLTNNGSILSALGPLFETLKKNVSKGFLDALMNSGNSSLALSLAQDPNAAAAASAAFDANAGMAKGLGDQTAQAVLGDKITKAYSDENKKLIDQLKDQPGKLAKEIRKELAGLEFHVTGEGAGRRAYLRGMT